ncbi:hypothetical protein SUDANB120_01049 [Streptomyces sp. enrichment culture]|uniref:hypothetical protein n=1 Tax=Streptomyces sp. enrichment culture TaxID=1795815 RepID=UPI003F57AACC
MHSFEGQGAPGGGTGAPVTLSLPREEPTPAAGCDVCAALASQRSDARKRRDMSAVSDANVELRAHPHKGGM